MHSIIEQIFNCQVFFANIFLFKKSLANNLFCYIIWCIIYITNNIGGNMKTKKFSGAIFAVCVLCLATILLGACGTTYIKPWEKTLSYSGLSDATKTTYTLENKELTLTEVLTKYFDKINWNTTLNKSAEKVKNAANALSEINSKAQSALSENKKVTNLKFTFSTEKDKKVTIDGTTKYNVSVKPESKPEEYTFVMGSGTNAEKITLKHATADCYYFETNIEDGKTSNLPTTKFTFEIKFNSAIEGKKGANKLESIFVVYYAQYKIA